MSPTPIQMAVVTASAMLAAAIGVFAALRRGHWLVTLLFSSAFLCVAAYQAGTLAILDADGPVAARTWASYLAGASALASWLWLGLSVVLARPQPIQNLRHAAPYLTLALVGCVVLFFVAGTRYVVSAVEGVGSGAVLVLGGMGKIYLMYLVVVMVGVLMNLERMLRSAPASAQRQLRSLFAAFAIGILAQLLMVSAGLLQGRIQVSWMAAGAVPMFAAGVMTSLALARHSLSDMTVPVARPVVYLSSISLTFAAVFLLVVGVVSRLLPMLPTPWQHGVSASLHVVAAGAALALVFNPRANRAVRRFVDRNFYAHRYDYRREWERVSRAITPTSRPEEICHQIALLVEAVFEAERVAIHLRDPRAEVWVLAHAPAGWDLADAEFVVRDDNPVVAALDRTRAPLIFNELAGDLDLVPVLVENRSFIERIGAAICAPLHVGDELVGMLWLSEKQTDEPYTFEDAEFLGAMSRQLAAALGFARLADQLSEARQLESLHRLSSFVLHDMKNQVSGLSLVVENAKRHLSHPEFQRDAIQVLGRAVQNLRQLMAQVSGVGRPPVLQPVEASIRQVIDEALAAAGLKEGENPGVRVSVRDPEAVSFRLDPALVGRVITNLVTNAREAMRTAGEIEISVRREPRPFEVLSITVRDDGPGMSEAFVRRSLFRPFATTKASGLGIGLLQCKTIVDAHGGSIRVESRPGSGTWFEVRLPVAATTAVGVGDASLRGTDAG